MGRTAVEFTAYCEAHGINYSDCKPMKEVDGEMIIDSRAPIIENEDFIMGVEGTPDAIFKITLLVCVTCLLFFLNIHFRNSHGPLLLTPIVHWRLIKNNLCGALW